MLFVVIGSRLDCPSWALRSSLARNNYPGIKKTLKDEMIAIVAVPRFPLETGRRFRHRT
jgi:hypothetical protein